MRAGAEDGDRSLEVLARAPFCPVAPTYLGAGARCGRLEHVVQHDHVLRQCASVVAPGGHNRQ